MVVAESDNRPSLARSPDRVDRWVWLPSQAEADRFLVASEGRRDNRDHSVNPKEGPILVKCRRPSFYSTELAGRGDLLCNLPRRRSGVARRAKRNVAGRRTVAGLSPLSPSDK